MSDEQFREDELVSAYLDGEATPAEIAEVEQDDALTARVEQLRSVRDAVAAPCAPMSAERREQMIGAALAMADAEDAQRRGAGIVPLHRRRETLLAVAAAAILLAAVVSAGLIASRGGDDSAEVAAEAPTAVADTDDSADHETTAGPDTAIAEAEPMAAEQPMAAAEAADEAAMAALDAAPAELAAAEAESAADAPAEEAADLATASSDEADREAEDARRTADDADQPVVDLGPFESLQSLLDDVGARWSAALEDGPRADSGTCSAAVHERERELEVDTGRPFVATVGADDPLVFDGRFARRADGAAVVIYAAPPACETGIHDLDESDGS